MEQAQPEIPISEKSEASSVPSTPNQSEVSENEEFDASISEAGSQKLENQDNVSKVDEIKAKLSAEIEKVENDIVEVQKLKEESIEKIELRKKELRELSTAVEICEEKEITIREMKEQQKEIEDRKISLTLLDETIANLDKQISEIQAQHDKATADLISKRRKLNEQLLYYDALNQRLKDLLELIQKETKQHEEKLNELLKTRSEIMKRTDLTADEIKKLVNDLDEQIKEQNKEHDYLLDCYSKRLSDIQISEPSSVHGAEVESGSQLLTEEQIKQIEVYETTLSQKKRTLSQEERLRLLRTGIQITPSGRIITQDDQLISLSMLEEEEEEPEVIPAELLEKRVICYPSTSTISSSEKSSSLESEINLYDINYLKRVFGNSLSLALAEITAVQPSDPIHYLAHWFIKYRYNQEIDDVKRLELQALMIERDKIEAERWHKELQEEAHLAVLEALFRAENIIMQQDFLKYEMLEMEGESIDSFNPADMLVPSA